VVVTIEWACWRVPAKTNGAAETVFDGIAHLFAGARLRPGAHQQLVAVRDGRRGKTRQAMANITKEMRSGQIWRPRRRGKASVQAFASQPRRFGEATPRFDLTEGFFGQPLGRNPMDLVP
jgi:hypothetical protein